MVTNNLPVYSVLFCTTTFCRYFVYVNVVVDRSIAIFDFIGHFLFHSYRCQMVERIPSILVSHVYVLNDHCLKLECSDYATL